MQKEVYGILYIIKNTVNSNIYIGITYRPLKIRWQSHVSEAKTSPRKLYLAMRLLGVEKFTIEEIGRYPTVELELREVEYIAKYDSYNNGYNSDIGGRGGNISIKKQNLIVNDYTKGMSNIDISVKYDVSMNCIRSILSMHDINTPNETNKKGSGDKVQILRVDTILNKAKAYRSIKEAYRELITEGSHEKTKQGHFYYQLKYACGTNKIAYGYFWSLLIDVIIEDAGIFMIFRSSSDKLAYIGGEETYETGIKIGNKILLACKSNDGHFSNGRVRRDGVAIKQTVVKTTEDKVESIKYSREYIEYLYNNHTLEAAGKILGITGVGFKKRCIKLGIYTKKTVAKPPKDILEGLIKTGCSIREIASEYNVEEFKVKYWLSEYELHCTKFKRPVVGICDNSNNILLDFCSYTDAGEYVKNKGLSTDINYRIGAKIKLVADGKRKSAYGLKWKNID